MSKNIAITLPGQGSQSVGMLVDLAAAYPVVLDAFAEGSDAVGIDLWKLSQEGPKLQLNETQNTQPALLCAGVGVKCVLEQQLNEPAAVEAIAGRGAEIVLEAGPGKVLVGLIKRIDKSLPALPVFDPASLDTAMESINA